MREEKARSALRTVLANAGLAAGVSSVPWAARAVERHVSTFRPPWQDMRKRFWEVMAGAAHHQVVDEGPQADEKVLDQVLISLSKYDAVGQAPSSRSRQPPPKKVDQGRKRGYNFGTQDWGAISFTLSRLAVWSNTVACALRRRDITQFLHLYKRPLPPERGPLWSRLATPPDILEQSCEQRTGRYSAALTAKKKR